MSIPLGEGTEEVTKEIFTVYDDIEFKEFFNEFDIETFSVNPSQWGLDIPVGSYTGAYTVYMDDGSIDTLALGPNFKRLLSLGFPSSNDPEKLVQCLNTLGQGLNDLSIDIVKDGTLTAENHAVIVQVRELYAILTIHPMFEDVCEENIDTYALVAEISTWFRVFNLGTSPITNPRVN
jgi:hypothetical protein